MIIQYHIRGENLLRTGIVLNIDNVRRVGTTPWVLEQVMACAARMLSRPQLQYYSGTAGEALARPFDTQVRNV